MYKVVVVVVVEKLVRFDESVEVGNDVEVGVEATECEIVARPQHSN